MSDHNDEPYRLDDAELDRLAEKPVLGAELAADRLRWTEAEIIRLRAEVADLRTRLDTAWGDVGAMQGIVEQRTAERDTFAAEIHLLRARLAWRTVEGVALAADFAALKADLVAEQGYRAAAEEIARRRGEMVDALTAERDEAREQLRLANIDQFNSEAENASLKPQSNADAAPIPLKSWVIEVFQHLFHSPHTPDSWKRDLNQKTTALLNAIEQGKEAKP